MGVTCSPHLPEHERGQQRPDRHAEEQRADPATDRHEQDEEPSHSNARDVRRPGHPPGEQALPHQEEHGTAEHHRQADPVERVMWFGDQQVGADRGRDDPGDDRQVEVGVGVAGEATGVVTGAQRDARLLAGRAEVQPPQRRGLDEGDAEAEHDRRSESRGGGGGPGYHDRLAEGDDDEQLAALGEVASVDVVVGRGCAATARQPVAGRGRGELEREGR